MRQCDRLNKVCYHRVTSPVAVGAGVEQSLETNASQCFGSEPLRSPCKHRSLVQREKGADMSWEDEKVSASSDIVRNRPSTGGCGSTAGQRKGPHQPAKCADPVTLERQTALTPDELSIFRVQQILKPLWFISGSNLGVTVTGPVWATKKTVHMLRQHIQGTVGLGSLPVSPSHKCCLK